MVISNGDKQIQLVRCRKPNEVTLRHAYFYKLANKYDVALTWKVHYPPSICDLCITAK
jgi:hypothetical protein